MSTLSRVFFLLVLAGLSAVAKAQPAGEGPAIRALMQQFDQAIQKKDLGALRDLFFEGRIVWRSTAHPSSRAMLERAGGRTVKAVEEQGAYEMLQDPRTASLAFRETFGEPAIVTDGQMASVTFNYDFRINDRIQNWGLENWQLAKVDNQWKIVSLLFSVRLQALEAAPQGHTR